MRLLWMMRCRRRYTLRYTLPGFVVLAIGLPFLPEEVMDRIGTLSPDEIEKDGSAASRLVQLPWALKAILSNPISGIGLLNFIPWSTARGAGYQGVIHNVYLNVFAEMGIMGFGPMITVVVLTWRDFTQSFLIARRMRAHKDPDSRWIEMFAVMLQISLAGFLIFSMAHPTMKVKAAWMLFAVSTALRRIALEPRAKLTTEEEREPPLWEALQPAAAGAPAYRSPSR